MYTSFECAGLAFTGCGWKTKTEADEVNTDSNMLCCLLLLSCDPQMISSRLWALNRAHPLLSAPAPRRGSTDPDWASTRPARPWTCPSSAPPCLALCRGAPLSWPLDRDHTPWTSLKCVPVWSPRWLADTPLTSSLLLPGCLRGSEATRWSGLEGGWMKTLSLCLCSAPLRSLSTGWMNRSRMDSAVTTG